MNSVPRRADGSVDEGAFADPPGIEIYKTGLCYVSLCSALPIDEVKALMAAYPTGISSSWTLSDDTTFASGQPHPCPCEANPSTHTHYLFSC